MRMLSTERLDQNRRALVGVSRGALWWWPEFPVHEKASESQSNGFRGRALRWVSSDGSP